jgi:osmotically inducible lipoprotein OsmB
MAVTTAAVVRNTTRTSKRFSMTHTIRGIATILALGAVFSLGACAGMNQQERGTAVGAGVGAVGGAILTGGSTIGTLGGAALGGYIGHETNK